MTRQRLLLCTDLDRTVIPNGSEPEHPAAREQFRAFCRQPGICLVYVTGRDRCLVQEAIAAYALPEPAYAITDVGSRICQVHDGRWSVLHGWEQEIAVSWGRCRHADLEKALRPVAGLRLQERAKQNRFKLSYYVDLAADHERVLRESRERLAQLGVAASLTWSIDEPRRVGLLDVLPENAGKLHALHFLQRRLGFADDEVIFAGDSGNDLPVLASAVRSILVANASAEVQSAAMELVRRNGHPERLYLARQQGFAAGGNYAAGILQGVWHFFPQWRHQLKEAGYTA